MRVGSTHGRGLLALFLVACNGQLPLMEPDDPHPVPDAARPLDVPPPARRPDVSVDARLPDPPDAALPDGSTGFRIVAGAAIVEAVPNAPNRVRHAPPSAPISVAPGTTPVAPPVSVRYATPMQTIRAHQGDVSNCYGRVALKDPSIRGRLTIQWTIGKDGIPMAVAITEDTLKDKSVGACVKEKARSWRFPPPGGGVQVISYPFDLRVQ